MALKSRAHEILMAEMAVVAKRYRRERGRLYEANRKLLQRSVELEAQVLCMCAHAFFGTKGRVAFRCYVAASFDLVLPYTLADKAARKQFPRVRRHMFTREGDL